MVASVLLMAGGGILAYKGRAHNEYYLGKMKVSKARYDRDANSWRLNGNNTSVRPIPRSLPMLIGGGSMAVLGAVGLVGSIYHYVN